MPVSVGGNAADVAVRASHVLLLKGQLTDAWDWSDGPSEHLRFEVRTPHMGPQAF